MILALLTAAVLAGAASQPAARTVTFEADVAPIIQSRCVTCHRADGDAPFSLASIDDVRRRASMIVTVTKSRYMPPWKPAPGAGNFRGSRRMSDQEIAIIDRWVRSGMQERAPGAPGAPDAPDAPAVSNQSSGAPIQRACRHKPWRPWLSGWR